ncbi:hypothetical protein D3C80_953400 [compost metagenome]
MVPVVDDIGLDACASLADIIGIDGEAFAHLAFGSALAAIHFGPALQRRFAAILPIGLAAALIGIGGVFQPGKGDDRHWPHRLAACRIRSPFAFRLQRITGAQRSNEAGSVKVRVAAADELRQHAPAAGITGAIKTLLIHAELALHHGDGIADETDFIEPARPLGDAGNIPGTGARQFAAQAAGQRHDHETVTLGKLVPAAAVQLTMRIAVGTMEIEHDRQRLISIIGRWNKIDAVAFFTVGENGKVVPTRFHAGANTLTAGRCRRCGPCACADHQPEEQAACGTHQPGSPAHCKVLNH